MSYHLLRGLAIGGLLILGAIDFVAVYAMRVRHNECTYAVAQYEELDRITDRLAATFSQEEFDNLIVISREVAHSARSAAAVCLGRPVETDDENGVEL